MLPPDFNKFDLESTKVAPTQPKLNMTRSTSGLPKSSPPYKDCKAPENARDLARAVNARPDSENTSEVTGEIIVPRGTFNRATEKERDICKDATHCAIYGNVEPEPKK